MHLPKKLHLLPMNNPDLQVPSQLLKPQQLKDPHQQQQPTTLIALTMVPVSTMVMMFQAATLASCVTATKGSSFVPPSSALSHPPVHTVKLFRFQPANAVRNINAQTK
jgi:hypothetical protein